VLGLRCSARPDNGDGAAHGGSDERHAAKNLVSTSTTGLIHVYTLLKRRQHLIIVVIATVQTNELE